MSDMHERDSLGCLLCQQMAVDEGSISISFEQLFCNVALTFVQLVMMPFGTEYSLQRK